MIDNETLAKLQMGTLITQAIIVNTLHKTGTIDKQHIIDQANEWITGLETYTEAEASGIKAVITDFIQMIQNDTEGNMGSHNKDLPPWLRGVFPGGKP